MQPYTDRADGRATGPHGGLTGAGRYLWGGLGNNHDILTGPDHWGQLPAPFAYQLKSCHAQTRDPWPDFPETVVTVLALRARDLTRRSGHIGSTARDRLVLSEHFRMAEAAALGLIDDERALNVRESQCPDANPPCPAKDTDRGKIPPANGPVFMPQKTSRGRRSRPPRPVYCQNVARTPNAQRAPVSM